MNDEKEGQGPDNGILTYKTILIVSEFSFLTYDKLHGIKMPFKRCQIIQKQG